MKEQNNYEIEYAEYADSDQHRPLKYARKQKRKWREIEIFKERQRLKKECAEYDEYA